MPAEELLTPLGQEWRSWLPLVLRDSPDHLAVIHAVAKEFERAEEAIETVRRQFVPQTADVLLKAHEAQLRMTAEPEGQTIEQRRTAVLVARRRQSAEPAGATWEENVTAVIGPGWSYEEHIPGDPTSPPPYTIRITLPYAPASSIYAQIEAVLREITPAHLDLLLQYSGGFVLDVSQLDEEGLG